MTPQRWLLARPRGGFNDVLCQIEKCWTYAEKTHRRLVIDTRDSGLLLDFHDLFQPVLHKSGIQPEPLTASAIEQMNQRSSFPSDTQGGVTNYTSEKDANDEFFTTASHQPLKVSLDRDYPEDVVVYEAMGGGLSSLCALSRLSFTSRIANPLVEGLKKLPSNYVGIHVRYSDMRTDFTKLFEAVDQQVTLETPVFIASDSDDVLEYGRDFFGKTRTLTPQRNSPRQGEPLHTPTEPLDEEKRWLRTTEMLVELFALAGARRLFFSDVNERMGVSGFSRLAAHLSKRPQLRAQLVGPRSEELVLSAGMPTHVAPLKRQLLEKTRWWRDARCVYGTAEKKTR